MTSVFLVPLAALVAAALPRGRARRRAGSSLRLGPLLALQLPFSTEVFFTLTLCLAAGLAARRRWSSRRGGAGSRASLLPLVGAYGVCAVVVTARSSTTPSPTTRA